MGRHEECLWRSCCKSLLTCLCPFPSAFLHQIENASEVLITPLEKFRKEQIGAARVRNLQTLFMSENCSAPLRTSKSSKLSEDQRAWLLCTVQVAEVHHLWPLSATILVSAT